MYIRGKVHIPGSGNKCRLNNSFLEKLIFRLINPVSNPNFSYPGETVIFAVNTRCIGVIDLVE